MTDTASTLTPAQIDRRRTALTTAVTRTQSAYSIARGASTGRIETARTARARIRLELARNSLAAFNRRYPA